MRRSSIGFLLRQMAERNIGTLVLLSCFLAGSVASAQEAADEAYVKEYMLPAQTEPKSRPRNSTSSDLLGMVRGRHSPRGARHSLFLRGSSGPIVERDVPIAMPNREALRHSMLAAGGLQRSGSNSGLGETVSSTLRGSYAMRAALEAANAADARRRGAASEFLPKVMANIEASDGPEDYTDILDTDTGRRKRVQLDVELSMPLFTSGVFTNGYRQAKQLSLASDYNYIAEEHKAALEAIEAHINLRLNRRIERTLSRNVGAMEKLRSIARVLHRAGQASKTDIATASVNVEKAKAELDLARRSRENVKADFKGLTGRRPPAKLHLPKSANLVPSTLKQAIASGIRHNPSLIASRHDALSKEYAALAERGRFGPQVNLYGGYTRNLYDSRNNRKKDDWQVGIRLKVPLLDMTTVSSVAAARHEALEAQYNSLDSDRLVRKQIETLWNAWQSSFRREKIFVRQVAATRASLRGARKKYEAGFESISDVLDEQVELASALISLETVRHEKELNAYQLAFMTGRPEIRRLVALR